MDYKVIVTQSALNDLEGIVAYIRLDAPRAAQRLTADLMKRAESLSAMPKRG